MKRALTIALACADLALLSVIALAQSETGVEIRGGPGSVTINGKSAPPGTLLLVVVGPDANEIVSGERVQPDGSWSLWLLHSWERVHLNVDGFRVPGGPFEVAELGAKGDMRLAVGIETDPEPWFVVVHARSEHITLFDEPAPDGAELGVFIDGEFYSDGPLTVGRDWDGDFRPGAEVSFTINGFPVAGGPIWPDPADAPLWITLHAGDPEHPPFRFYGPPGDVVDLRSLCSADPLPPLEVIGYTAEGWERIVPVQPDGSWVLETPSGMTDLRFVVASIGRWLTDRPKEGPRYDASPSAGSQIVLLNHTQPLWYQFRGDISAFRDEAPPEAENTGGADILVEVRRGRTIIEQRWVRPGESYQISVPYGTLGVSLWVNGQRADRSLHNAVLGEPDPETGSGCVKRVDLEPQALAASAPPASLWTLEWLLLQRGTAPRAGLE